VSTASQRRLSKHSNRENTHLLFSILRIQTWLDIPVFMKLLSRQWDTVTRPLAPSTKPAKSSVTFSLSLPIMGSNVDVCVVSQCRNAEKMISDDGKSPHTAHTVRPPSR